MNRKYCYSCRYLDDRMVRGREVKYCMLYEKDIKGVSNCEGRKPLGIGL